MSLITFKRPVSGHPESGSWKSRQYEAAVSAALKIIASLSLDPVTGRPRFLKRVTRSEYDRRRVQKIYLKCCWCRRALWVLVSQFVKRVDCGYRDFYCSFKCSTAHHAVKNSRSCPTCGGPLPHRSLKYCSLECRPRVFKPQSTCQLCGKVFEGNPLRRKYCGKQCADWAHSLRMMGSGNSHFKHGEGRGKLWKLIKPLIKERDGHRCVVCQAPDLRILIKKTWRSILAVHHIDVNPQNNRPENLVTVCYFHHMQHHKLSPTPFPWFASYAKRASQCMTSKWKETITSLLRKFSSTTV